MTTDRATYIGGGDQAHLLDIAPYGCYRRLILSKRQPIEQDLSDNLHVLRGQYLEPSAAQFYSDTTGRKLRNQSRWTDQTTRTGMAMDRHIVAFDERGPGVLEIKCPSSMVFRRYLRDGGPVDYSAQLNWYMGMVGWKWGSFAFVNFETAPGLLSYDVDFDAELYRLQTQKADEAWKLVEFGPLPDAKPADSKACSRCPYFDGCHPGELPTPDTDLVQISGAEMKAALTDYSAASEVIAEAELLKDEAKTRIKALIGEATAVEAPGARIYHRATARTSIDGKKLAKDFPDAAQACSKTTTFRALRIFERTN